MLGIKGCLVGVCVYLIFVVLGICDVFWVIIIFWINFFVIFKVDIDLFRVLLISFKISIMICKNCLRELKGKFEYGWEGVCRRRMWDLCFMVWIGSLLLGGVRMIDGDFGIFRGGWGWWKGVVIMLEMGIEFCVFGLGML